LSEDAYPRLNVDFHRHKVGGQHKNGAAPVMQKMPVTTVGPTLTGGHVLDYAFVMMKRLPIGTQDFPILRETGCLYVDKTALIHQLVQEGRVYFLSRPRRFGKSLLLSTLKAIFQGRRELFTGLAIDALPGDWKAHPILHLDFGAERFADAPGLAHYLADQIERFILEYRLSATGSSTVARFSSALATLAARGERTVVLIDEYDKPILDHIENTPLAAEMRDILKGFYGSLKSNDAYLRFLFLTGVSKFAKMNVFSGLNNLMDITLDERYATLLGYTQDELEANFPDRIEALCEHVALDREECLAKIRDWYNGYRFHPRAERVYNPFSTLLLFQKREFGNYWFETGTPTFLLKLIRRSALPPEEIGTVRLGSAAFSAYEPERLTPYPLLFQTGYVTIADYDPENEVYRLDYPNREVRQSFMQSLVAEFAHIETEREAGYRVQMLEALNSGDLDAFFEVMAVFFANIPYNIQIKAEKYYQSIFYLIFALLGLRMETEVRTGRGRIDAVALTATRVYVFEFKLDGSATEALAQCRELDYAKRYQGSGRDVLLVGVPFDTATRNIGQWQTAPA